MRLLYRCHDPHCIRLHKIVEDRKFCFHEIDTATKEPEPKPAFVWQTTMDEDTIEIYDATGNVIGRYTVGGVITADQIQAGSITANKIVVHNATPLDNSVTFRAEQWMLMKIQNPQSFVRIDNVT